MDRLLAFAHHLLLGCMATLFLIDEVLADPHILVGVMSGVEREISVADGQLEGRFAPYYRCVFDHVDRDFRFVELPLAQLLAQLRGGRVAVGIPLIRTSGRDKYADFGGRLFQTEYVYLMLNNLPPLNHSSGLTYSFVRRFVGEDLMKGENPKLLGASDWRQSVELLKKGRADVVVLPWVLVDSLMEDYSGEYYLRNATWADLSLYVSHAYGDSRLTEELRAQIRHCRYQNDMD